MTILIIAFLVAGLLFWLHGFFVLYHFIRFGVGTRPKQAALIFFVGSLGLFFLLFVALIGIMLEVPPVLKIININNAAPSTLWQ
jgi:hypothetical protein